MSSQIEYNGRFISVPPKPLTPPKMMTAQPEKVSKKIPRTLTDDIYKTFKTVYPKFLHAVEVSTPKVVYGAQIAKTATRKTAAISIVMVNILMLAITRIKIPKWVIALFRGTYLARFASGHSPRVSARILQWTGIVSLFIPLVGLVIAPLALSYSKNVKFRNNKIDYYTYLNMLPLALYGVLLAVSFTVAILMQVIVFPIIDALP